jgi:hypothetical protein
VIRYFLGSGDSTTMIHDTLLPLNGIYAGNVKGTIEAAEVGL